MKHCLRTRCRPRVTAAAVSALALTGGLALGTALAPMPAHAQGTTFPDTPANHWAYAAVQSLADKGLVKGYPDGKFLGNRALTRYEFATVIDRVLDTVADLTKTQPGVTADDLSKLQSQLTQDDLNRIQALTDKFQPELTAIQADVAKAKDDIEALRADVLDAKDLANKAQTSANAAYSSNAKSKFVISGYIQARFLSGGGDKGRYPQGTPTATNSYNGDYATGSNLPSFVLRRSRLKFTGALTPNTKYAIQIDASGTASNTPGGSNSSNLAVAVREGNFSYTFGDGSAKYPTLTAGLFGNPFGYELPMSSSSILATERPLAFNETSAGLFSSQDYDRGAQVSYGSGPFKYTAALVNGTGYTTDNESRRVDQIYRVSYQSPNKVLGIGASYYNGHIGAVGAPPYQERKKVLTGVDVQLISASGPFVLAEYLGGTFEQRTYFDLAATSATNPLGLVSNKQALGNKVTGYYVQPGWTFGMTGNHPLTLFGTYDELRRSSSGVSDSGSSYDDDNWGYGALYNLDKATRLRLYYIKPTSVSHLSGTASPDKYGLTTAELQVKF